MTQTEMRISNSSNVQNIPKRLTPRLVAHKASLRPSVYGMTDSNVKITRADIIVSTVSTPS